MSIFGFSLSKKNRAELTEELEALKIAVGEKEAELESLKEQVKSLHSEELLTRNEVTDLKDEKEKTKKQVDGLRKKYNNLYSLMTKSAKKIDCLNSSAETMLTDINSPYLVALDEEDFNELCTYFDLKEEKRKYGEKKGLREQELTNIEQEIKDNNQKLQKLREALIEQRDINLANKEKLYNEEISKYSNELSEIKNDFEGYLKAHKVKMRFEILHEIYQRFTSSEDPTLRKLRKSIDDVNLEHLHYDFERWEDRKIVKNGSLVKEEYILCNLQNLCKEFIQLNIAKLTKEMKSSDWESVKLKIGTMIEVVESLLMTHGYTISDTYFESLYNVMEAKYISIQKQELEKEKAREEREAQREYERAIKKAVKDEEKAQEALERKKRELAEEQAKEKIAKLQEQIQGLEKALSEARELRERAMSMAQQTKIGYVYVISNIGSFGKDVYKIGMTRRLDPMERVLELSNASVPFPFDVHTFIYSEDAPALEADLHRKFDSKKINSINYRKEYFHVSLDEIKAALKEKGIETNFIDEPDAFQYRESKLKNNQYDFLKY